MSDTSTAEPNIALLKEIDELNRSAWEVIRSKPHEGIDQAEQALAKAQKSQYKKGEALATGIIGAGHIWLSDYEKALTFSQKAKEMMEEIGDSYWESQILYNIAITFYYLSDFDSTLKYGLMSSEMSKKAGDLHGIANALNITGTVYYTIGENDNAIKTLEKGLDAAESAEDILVVCKILDGLGTAHFNKGDYHKAREYKQRSLEEVEKIGVLQVKSYALDGLGAIHAKLKEYDKALDFYSRCRGIRTEMGFKAGEAETILHMGQVHLESGNKKEGLNLLDEAISLAEEVGAKEVVYRANETLADHYESEGDVDKFIEHFKAYHAYKQEHLSEKARQQIKGAEMQARMEQMEEEKELLEKKNKELKSYFRDVQTLSEIGNEITSTHDFESIFQIVYERINSLMDASGIFIGLLNKEATTIEVKLALDKGERDEYFEYSMDRDNTLPVWSIKNKKPVYINDYEREIHNYLKDPEEFVHKRPESLIVLPLMVKEKVIGVLFVQSFDKNAYSLHHFNILKSFANYSAIALDNAFLYTDQEKRNRNAHMLSEIGQKISASLSVEKIIEDTYETLNTLMDATVFGIAIHQPESNTLLFTGALEKGKKLPEFSYNVDDDKIATNCFKDSLEIRINDWETEYDKYVSGYNKAQAGETPESMMYMTLKSKDKNVGVITIQSFKKHAYSDYDLDILRTLSVYVGNALDNARLYEHMEEMVEARTAEVVKRKEEIEQSYSNTRLLGEIGQQITSTLDFEAIFEKLHENVNKLMDAACFGVRLYDPQKQVIHYRFEMERGGRGETAIVPMSNKDNYSVVCVEKKQEILINDNQKEYHKWVSQIHVVSGDMPHSLIFCPMLVGDRVLGVITVQSFDRNAYTEYHMDMLRTLASYTAIALDNAALYENLEDKVKERTEEVVRQKEEIERTYRDGEILTNVGKKITSILSAEKIVAEVYESINELMNAPCLGIGVYKKDSNSIAFPGYIENGETMVPDDYDLEEDAHRLACICFTNREEIITNDFTVDAHKWIEGYVPPKVGGQTESIMYLPLMIQDKCVGVFTIQSFDKNAFTDYHVNMARSICIYTAIAIDNANLYESLEEQVRERTAEVVKQKEAIEKTYQDTRLLGEIGRQITSSLSIEKIISETYKNVNNLMDATMFGIGILDKENNAILMPGFYENNVQMDDFSYDLNDKNRLAVLAFDNNQEIVINNYFEEYNKYIKQAQKPVSGKDSTSIVYIPLSSHGKVMGVITVQSWEVNAYSDYHVSMLRNMGVYAAIALENAMLYENMEDEVKQRTAEVVAQAEIIEEKNKSITDSIKYAQRIQQATLPAHNLAKQLFKDSFILFKPKDIVSGDFYWMEKQGDEFIFAVVDCTGHGVPGAFMSLIGHNALNQIVNEKGVTEPGKILNMMNHVITNTLNKTTSDDTKMRDGMDAAICSINVRTNMLQFAGAYNPLWLVRNGEVQEIKGDKQPIGHFDESDGIKRKDFTNYDIQLKENDCLYIFSDGYADQFGGPRGKKFKYTQFKQLLIDIHDTSMDRQLAVLDNTLEDWKGEIEQIDDVCVIGVRL